MAFMIQAVKALKLSGNNSPLKKTVEGWLMDNWPSELGDISKRQVEHMATLLRPPEAQKGGNTKAKKPGKGGTP